MTSTSSSNNLTLPFPDAQFRTVYADPPWPEIGGGVIVRGAQAHYALMKVPDIAAMGSEVRRVALPDAHLYLWVTNNYLHDGLHVMEAWGFRYVTTISWAKDRFGLGQYFRGMTEHCLFGVRGMVPYKVLDGKRQQGTTLLNAPRQEHSAKPLSMYEKIEKVSTGPYLELFSRQQRQGWQSWGNESAPRPEQGMLIGEAQND
ncbi:MAG: MT-A70 family methyltransferase [Dehalococcoidales bacterium]|nr:MT-A70 family methyltransferase [Dehalococcoidales bacterium]